MGRLADRLGRGTVFLAGYLLLALTYVSLLLPLGAAQVPVAILLLGTYYAMTDGVLMALASGLIPPAMRASGLGLLASATGLGRLVASVGFGLVWSVFGIQVAITCFLAVLVAVWGLAALLMVRAKLGLRHV
jgi:MFS family permease